jgi:hypothetical protein
LGRRKRKSTDKTPPAPPALNSFTEAKEAFDLLMLNELQKIAEARNDSAKLIFVAKVRTLLEAKAAAKGREGQERTNAPVKTGVVDQSRFATDSPLASITRRYHF